MDQVIDFFIRLLGTESWPPRWHCGAWTDFHGWLYIISDLGIWGAYFIIPLLIFNFLSKKEGLPLLRVFWLFIAFILFCGLTHFIDAIIFWWPAYRLSALIRFVTAMISWATVFMLIKILPEALKLKTSAEFEAELLRREKIEKEFLEAQALIVNNSKQLELKNKELEQFAFIASHDLQEPVRTVTSLMKILQEETKETLTDEASQYVDLALQTTERMKNLINGLLDYGRIGKDRALSNVDCDELIKSVFEDLQVKIKETNARIEAEKLPEILAYPTELRLLFQNLIVNAIKFMNPGVQPKISIKAVNRIDEWEFKISDNGIGIEDRFKDKIFIIFQRLHSKKAFEGTGIGLAHCKKIIELHGGRIWVESIPNEGSTFFFSIPKLIANGNSNQLHPAH